MSKKIDLLKAQFTLNMRRISGLVKLVLSGEIEVLKPIGFAEYEGASADILRFSVVFLHATFEMLVRSLTQQPDKKWCFYSGTDIEKALRRSDIDPKPFKSLYRPLTQLAKRRKRIVHHADLSKPTDKVVEKWTIVDYWQLCMWNLAVLAFYFRLLVVTNEANEVESRMHVQVGKAMTTHVEFGKQLLAFPETPAELRIEALQKLGDTLKNMIDLLDVQTGWFLKDET